MKGNARLLMMASALVLGAAGLVASFAPVELLGSLGAPAAEPLPVLIQLLGVLYFAFAMTNWMAKDSMIGGIYARPLSVGNFVHFVMGALALAKQQLAHGPSLPVGAVLVVYAVFAVLFGRFLFGRGPA